LIGVEVGLGHMIDCALCYVPSQEERLRRRGEEALRNGRSACDRSPGLDVPDVALDNESFRIWLAAGPNGSVRPKILMHHSHLLDTFVDIDDLTFRAGRFVGEWWARDLLALDERPEAAIGQAFWDPLVPEFPAQVVRLDTSNGHLGAPRFNGCRCPADTSW